MARVFLLFALMVVFGSHSLHGMARPQEDPQAMLALAERFVARLTVDPPPTALAVEKWFQERKDISPFLKARIRELLGGVSQGTGQDALSKLLGVPAPVAETFSAVEYFAGREHWRITLRGTSSSGIVQEFDLVFVRGNRQAWVVGEIGVISI